jgi:4-hydroxyphenylacetate 3-monooxygenase
MPARTGKEFLAGLKAPRELWVGDEKVSDLVSHPALAGAANTIAQVFDLQHQAADVCLTADPETGEQINLSHVSPHQALVCAIAALVTE